MKKLLLFLLAVVLGGVAALRLLPAERRARLRESLLGTDTEGAEVQTPARATVPVTDSVATQPTPAGEAAADAPPAPSIDAEGDERPGSAITAPFRTFFGVVVRGQSYRNLLYLALSFPLGLGYFIFLVVGLSVGASLIIIWVGIPILLLTLAGWWAMGMFERQLVIRLLRVDIPPMTRVTESGSMWARLKAHVRNPVTWKSLVYLFVEFPFGVLALSVLATAASLAALVAAPVVYSWVDLDIGSWEIDTLGEAFIWPVPGLLAALILMHVMNGMAYVWARFARLMLGASPAEDTVASASQPVS
jgi:hypothetical protein